MSKNINKGFYPENFQTDLYDYILDNIKNNQNSESALHGVTQSGKTNALLWVTCHLFDELTSRRNIDPYFLYISNESSNDLREQTIERFLPFGSEKPSPPNLSTNLGYDPKFNYIYLDEQTDFHHRSFFDTPEKRRSISHKIKNKDTTIIFFDEAHIAMKNDGSIHNFLDNLGINPSQDSSKWECENIHLVLVSATGYVQMAQPHKIEHFFVQPGKTHVSQNDLYDAGKVHDISNDLRSNAQFLKDLHADSKKYNQHTLLRFQGDENVDWLKNNVFKNENVKEYSSYARDIKSINNYGLSMSNEPSTVLLIRGGLRVGITLENHLKKKVRHAVDTDSTYASTVAQSLLGRFTGYPEDGFKKKEWIKKLPNIYCNLNVLEGEVGHLQYEEKVMDENWSVLPDISSDSNVTGTKENNSPYLTNEFDNVKDLVEYARSIGHDIQKHKRWNKKIQTGEFIEENYRGITGILTKEYLTNMKPSGGAAKYQAYACYEDTNDISTLKLIHYERVQHHIEIPSDSNVSGSKSTKSYVLDVKEFKKLDELLKYANNVGHAIQKHNQHNWRQKSKRGELIKDTLRNKQSEVLTSSFVRNNTQFGINADVENRCFATYEDPKDSDTLTFIHIHNTGRTVNNIEPAIIKKQSMYDEESEATKN